MFYPSLSLPVACACMTSVDPRTCVLFGLAVFCAVGPLSTSHLVFAALGAGGYLCLRALSPGLEARAKQSSREGLLQRGGGREARCAAAPRHKLGAPPSATGPVRSVSVVPVRAPTFQAVGWDAEVQELLQGRLIATASSDAMAAGIAKLVQSAISPLLPEAKVSGLVIGSLGSGDACGVAVPDLEVVIQVSPEVLKGRLLRGRSPKDDRSGALDMLKLQKAAIRACTDNLVGTAAFKFRRSAFRGEEPKVTLLAPTTRVAPGSSSSGSKSQQQFVPLTLSINARTPLQHAALLEECRLKAPKARDLILLVRRWAKDRGICQETRGHLSPHTWALLTVYFLEVGLGRAGEAGEEEEEARGLPLSLLGRCCARSNACDRGCDRSNNVVPDGPPSAAKSASAPVATRTSSVGQLLKAFFHFFAHDFGWHGREVAAPLSGCRRFCSCHSSCTGGVESSLLVLKDPFDNDEGRNLGNGLTTSSFSRLCKELQRASKLSTEGASFAALLEPWVPPADDGREEEE